MGDLTSKFTRDDIETLIEAMGDWEMLGNQEFHFLQMIKSAPLPPEDHEAFEAMQQIKDHFKKREKHIMASRTVRQEKAVFLKAKLMMVRKDIGIDQLFDMAMNTDATSESPKAAPVVDDEVVTEAPVKPKKKVAVDADTAKGLELAEYFIKDLGVWDHYQRFLTEKKKEESQ